MKRIRHVMPVIITAVMIILVFVLQFMVLGGRKIDASFWLILTINSALLIAVAITWLSGGIDRAKSEKGTAYENNSEEYAKKIADVEKAGFYAKLEKFCEEKTQEMFDEKAKAILGKACIDYDKYIEVKELSTEELIQNGFEKSQIKAIERVRHCGRFPEALRSNCLKIRPLRSMELTTNNKVKNKYDIHYNENADKSISIFVRVLKSVVFAIALAFISIEPAKDITDISAWALFLLRLLTIIFTAWGAEREGYELITITKNAVILKRISFLSLFMEWANSEKSLKDITSKTVSQSPVIDEKTKAAIVQEAESKDGSQPLDYSDSSQNIKPM